MKLEPLKDVDWFKLITDELCDKDINFSFPDEKSREVIVIDEVINKRIKSAVEWLLEKESEIFGLTKCWIDNIKDKTIRESLQSCLSQDRQKFKNKVKEAFEDATKKKTTGVSDTQAKS